MAKEVPMSSAMVLMWSLNLIAMHCEPSEHAIAYMSTWVTTLPVTLLANTTPPTVTQFQLVVPFPPQVVGKLAT